MKKSSLLLLFYFLILSSFAQTSNKEIALEKAREAVKIMDEGRIDESILLLKEGEKLDPENFIFPYEMAYAHVMKNEYEEAIELLQKAKKYNPTNSQVYQMSGNCYSYMGKPEKAILEYEEGMKLFPNAGNLYLEKGNIYLHQENYTEAIKNYEQGISIDPEFASNYFRLAKLFLNSNDKLSGLIYGETFMNLERSSERTLEMSKLLFDSYTSSISIGKEEIEIDFCDIVIDASESKNMEEYKLPLCAVFGKNFILGVVSEDEIDLHSLSTIRRKFIEHFFQEDYLKYPNVLFEYQKKMLDKGVFNAYSHYLLQMGAEGQFEIWLGTNEAEYNRFIDWYSKGENFIEITRENIYKREGT